MSTLIRLERIPYEEPHHLELWLTVASDGFSAHLTSYVNADDLRRLGAAFSEFPFGGSAEVRYELGSEGPGDRAAYYLRLRLYLVRPTGASGIEIRINNNEEPPTRRLAEFTLRSEVAGVNRLGALLTTFSKLDHRVLVWDGVDGALDPDGGAS
ncbi:MAG: hypothetical protein R2939_10560 [Kofleriaceae bacterium]